MNTSLVLPQHPNSLLLISFLWDNSRRISPRDYEHVLQTGVASSFFFSLLRKVKTDFLSFLTHSQLSLHFLALHSFFLFVPV